jgi:hypothetical protein
LLYKNNAQNYKDLVISFKNNLPQTIFSKSKSYCIHIVLTKRFYKISTKYKHPTPQINKKSTSGEKLDKKYKYSTFMKSTDLNKKSYKKKNN